MVEHLYVHIPFCPKVCPYCSFYKEASDRHKTQGFLDAVLAEAERHAEKLRPRTVFFGGGTPSALSPSQLEYLIGGLRRRIDFSGVTEFTLEMNPATVSAEKARLLLELGVNRISMGVQSWDPALLETLGRVHSVEQAHRSYGILRESGFRNVNLDLIFGIPGQTRQTWKESLEQTIALAPDHISAYCLTYEEDTEFFLRLARGEHRPDQDLDADLLEMTMDVLGTAGFEQYEISNHARPGRECLHNLAYWLGSDYLGLGPSAFSTVGRRRWKNVSDTAVYIAHTEAGRDAADFSETLDEPTRRRERVAFALRTNRGVHGRLLPREKVTEMQAHGLLTRQDGHWLPTRKGRMLADEIAAALME